MNIQEILQIMSDNAKPDENGDICKNGHVMHNMHFDGAPILVVDDHILVAVLYHPNRFTLAPRTHKVNGFDVPVPEVKKPGMGTVCHTAAASSSDFMGLVMWSGSNYCLLMLSRGLVHLTKEAAIANAKAMCGIDPEAEIEE